MAMMSESVVIDELARRGFETSLKVVGDQLRPRNDTRGDGL
jgi:hypothetical protein